MNKKQELQKDIDDAVVEYQKAFEKKVNKMIDERSFSKELARNACVIYAGLLAGEALVQRKDGDDLKACINSATKIMKMADEYKEK